VTDLVSEITAASKEQAQGVEQVSETMTQMEKVTQQNAAMVEEASAAAGSMQEQADALAGAIAVFRLHAEPPVAAPAQPAPPPAEVKKPMPVKMKKPAKKGNGHLVEGWQEF
jgi:methyl-accepting chemotaxis protein